MAETAVKLERVGAVMKLTLDRPEQGNCLNAAMGADLLSAASLCDTDPAIRCVVMTGAGKMFCGGGDINDFSAAGDDTPRMVTQQTGIFHAAISRLGRMEKPLISAVNGAAAGAGLSMAVLGDIVLAAPEAHFTFGYTAIGFAPDGGATWLLPRLIGLRRAQEMMLTNRRVLADEAVAIGLATRIVPGDVVAEAMALADQLANGPTRAFARTRALLMTSFGNGFETQMELEARAISAATGDPEGREGVAAFLERRAPDFRGTSKT